jgi:TrpR-related protein YerC/YecD
MAHQKRDEMKDYLFQAILSLQSLDDCYNFFDDLCTIKEVSEMANRMCGAKMLAENRVYTEITEKTGLSTATISRINRCLKYGSDGYSEVLRRLDEAGVEPPVKMDGKAEGTDNG